MLKDFRFHHIGYAVRCIEQTAQVYVGEQWHCTTSVVDPLQNVKIAFLEREGMPLIELVEPVDDVSPVVQILQKSGVSPYHICYEVPNMDDALKRLRRLKFIPLFKPVPAVALGGRQICYLFNAEVGLIELLQ